MTSPGGIRTEKRYDGNDGTARGWWIDARDDEARYSKRGKFFVASITWPTKSCPCSPPAASPRRNGTP